MSRIASVSATLPRHRYTQSELTEAFTSLCTGVDEQVDRLQKFHEHAGVEYRHLAFPLEWYAAHPDFGATNKAFIEAATELGSRAVLDALTQAGLVPEDVDTIMSTTVTGVAVPSLEARIAARIGLRPDVKRAPLFGLGCMAGAAGVARLHDMVRAAPESVAVFVSVELCSLTLQRDDPSTANLVASGLFGDGAAAVVLVGSQRTEPGPEIIDSRSHLYPDSERAMGWDVGATGLRIVLGAEVPDLVSEYLGDDIKLFLADHGLSISDIRRWVAHPGGPKVLLAVEAALGLTHGELDVTWGSLRRIGNLSSASVLHVLKDTLDMDPLPAGSPGLILAMGPGFASELVLLRW